MKKYLKYITSSIVAITLLCNIVLVHASAINISGAVSVTSITDAQAIYGFTYANNGVDAVNDIDIAVGGSD